MYSSKEVPREWYLIFAKAKYSHWIFRLLHKEISHVYAVKDLNDYQWLVVQPRANLTDTEILLKCEHPHITCISGPEDKIIKVSVLSQPENRGLPCWFNCTEQVKALIGVKSFWTFTPYQLYKGLIRGRYGERNK